LACTVVAQSGIDSRYAAAVRPALSAIADKAKQFCRRKPQAIAPLFCGGLASANQNLTSRLFFPRLRLAVDGDLDRRSANEKLLFF